MKVFISQKFRDLDPEEILRRKEFLKELMKDSVKYILETTYWGEEGKPSREVEFIENYHPDFDKSSVAQLGKSIIELSQADFMMASKTSFDNMRQFSYTGNPELIKGSEFELSICRSYGIRHKVYDFEYNSEGKAVRAIWI